MVYAKIWVWQMSVQCTPTKSVQDRIYRNFSRSQWMGDLYNIRVMERVHRKNWNQKSCVQLGCRGYMRMPHWNMMYKRLKPNVWRSSVLDNDSQWYNVQDKNSSSPMSLESTPVYNCTCTESLYKIRSNLKLLCCKTTHNMPQLNL